ncbi:amidohydrolase family protein [Lysinibacillus sp. NPDC093210]|uniref:amidohydrolase family protein n=1 Tax=Lysinibacillus sp. NPDC093210 TaxID=3364133 RepID=UPI0038029496
MVIVKDGMAGLEIGTLAGSVLILSVALKNMLKYCDDCTLEDVIRMTSTNPAKQLNIRDRKGSIKAGMDAD